MIKKLTIEKTSLPAGWKLTALGKVCEVIAGQSPESKFYNTNEKGLAFYQGKKEFTDKYIGQPTKWTTKITKEAIKNDILMSVRAPVGPVNFSIQKCCIGRGLAAIRASEKIDKEYLYNFLVKFENEIEGNEGAVFNSINKSQIGAIPIPLPPLPQQKQIVTILDKAFATIATAKANAEQNLQNAKELFESYLQNIFENKGDDWEEKTLEELLNDNWITSHLDGNHGGDYPRKNEFVESGVPYISANCLKDGYVNFEKAKYLTETRASKLRKGIAQDNDVLFAHNATVGPTALLKTNEAKVILGTSLTYYRCNEKYINPKYLLQYLRSKEFKSQYESIMTQSTRNQVPITKQRTFTHIIPPLEVQNKLVPKLVNLIDKIEKLEAIYTQKVEDLEEMKKSVLQKAFSGQLNTVN
ncbi:MAG: restriction endonuclease subunit S [Flavobacteriales bacterium]|nr:restriction endonuclease subunit S [Flavobacteriales bacterium]